MKTNPNLLVRCRGELVCIDPSVKALGWAHFSFVGGRWKLIRSGSIYMKCEYFIDGIDGMVEGLRLRELFDVAEGCVIEQPEMFSSGRGVAAANSGAVIKLVGAAFSIRQAFVDAGVPVLMVPVRKWKGTVPKSVTEMRVKRHWGWKGTDHNESDAVGIGDWYIRKGPGRAAVNSLSV